MSGPAPDPAATDEGLTGPGEAAADLLGRCSGSLDECLRVLWPDLREEGWLTWRAGSTEHGSQFVRLHRGGAWVEEADRTSAAAAFCRAYLRAKGIDEAARGERS